MSGWDWGYAARIFPDLLRGLLVTIELTIAGSALALVIGLLFAIARRSKVAPIRLVVGFVVEFIRTTPLLVQLYFLYFVLPDFGILLSAVVTGIIGLGLHFGCYMSEVFRAGIASVPRSQWEAATSLHFSPFRTWYSVVLPQATRVVVPVLGNYVIAMFKDSALLATISVLELMARAQLIGAATYAYFVPLTMVGLMYFAVSFAASIGVRSVERRLTIAKR
jgi:polar amino acid transport system permease protein